MVNANVGTAWISIVADTARMVPDIDKAIKKAEGSVSGEGLGKKLASGLGKTLKVGVASAGVAAGGILAASLTKGLGRLSGIENAQAKLAGLGHEAEGVESIMENALASVKGTAYGLEDAATVAASAVAAGIKPGKDLERTLKLTGDAANIAGVDMATMGSIVNKVATSDMMQMDVANQMMDAGIPILQMVADEMGVTAEEARKMASEGKISFETFQSALEEGVGGAALKAGETVQGSFANMGAAAGRFGAKLADPAFQAAPAIFTALGGVFDEVNDAITPATDRIGEVLTPALENLATIIETKVAPWMGELAGKAGELAASGLEKALDPETWTHVADIFGKVRDTVSELWPSIESLAGSFLTISQSVSVATWEALTSVLDALAPVIESVLVPLLEKVAEFAEENPETVEKMVWAFLAFKGVGAVAGPVGKLTGALANLGGAFSTVKTLVGAGGAVEGIKELGKYSKDANPVLAKTGKGVNGLGKVSGGVGKVLKPLGKALGTVIRFVNPWVAGITIIVGALTWFFTQTETGQAIVESVTEAIVKAWDWVKEKFGQAIDWIVGKWGEFTGWISTAWEGITSLFQGDYTGAIYEAFGIAEDSPLITFFFTARDFIKAAIDGIKDIFDQLVEKAQVTIGIIGTIVLTPFILAWNLLSWAIRTAWESIIKPVWDAIRDAAVAMWENHIKPALDAIALGWQVMSDKLSAIWEVIKTAVFLAWQSAVETLRGHWDLATGALSAAWQRVSDFFSAIWQGIKSFVFDAWNSYVDQVRANWDLATGLISAAWQAVSDRFTAIWGWIRDNVFQPMMNKISELWNAYASPIFQWVGDKWNWLRDMFVAGWHFIRDQAFAKLQDGLSNLKNFVSNIVDGIKSVWDNLRGHFARPINFMIDTVWNNGVLAAWETMRKILPGLKEGAPAAKIPGYAAGGAIQKNPTGRISGPGTGTSDSILARIANGEHMWTAAEVKALGSHEQMYRLRALIRNKIPFTTDGSGHFQPLPRGIDNSLGDLAGAAPDLLPKFRDGGEIKPAWESQLEAAHRFAKAQHGKPYQWAGPNGPGSSFDCSGFMGSIAATIQNTNPWQRYWATGSFPSPGAQGFVPGLGQGFSIGVWNGGPYGGHTSGTLSKAGGFGTTNVESGGSPSMVKYGIGAAGADSPQHKMHFHLPIGADGAFESGGAGGGFFDYLGGIKNWVKEQLGKIFDPIKDKLPSPPPEWMGVPGAGFKAGKDALTSTITDKVEALGNLTSAVWAKITDFDFSLFDTGGVWKPGTVGLNLSGKNEYVFTNRAMRDFQQATESLQEVAKELGIAFNGGDWGYGELSRYVGEDIARALVNESANLGIAKVEIDEASKGRDWGYGALSRYVGKDIAHAIVNEASWLGGAKDEVVAAFKGIDFGLASVARYLGGNEDLARDLLDEVSWIGGAVDEVSAAWQGIDFGLASVARYMGGNERLAIGLLNGVESLGTVAKEIGDAFRGRDWGTGEMERYIGSGAARVVFDAARAAGSFIRREHDDYIQAKYGDFGNLAQSLEVIAAGGPTAWGEAASDVINTALTGAFDGSKWLHEDSPLVIAALHVGRTLSQWQGQWAQSELNSELRKSAEDYAMGQARSALSMVGLGDVVDIATGVTQKVQGIMSDEEVRKGVEEVKRVALDPDGRYSGAEIEKKLRELGIEIDHIKSDLGGSLVGGLIGMA